MKTAPGSVWLGVSAVAVVTAVVVGLFLVGSPTDERARRLDDRRVEDLIRIAAATDLYWTRHSNLPESLDELMSEPGVTVNAADPISSVVYGYQPLDSVNYEVCATFDTQSGESSRYPSSRNVWVHGSGRQCFQLEVDEIITTPESRVPIRRTR